MTRKYLLLSAVAAAAAVTTSVSAQEADQGAELEEIVVTGSYLYTGLDSPSPVVVISGDELVMTAPADLGTYFFDNVTQNDSNDPPAQITADGSSLIVTSAPRFTEKSSILPGATFVIGFDTYIRLMDKRYYPDHIAGGASAVENSLDLINENGCCA